ncbi:SRPBCC domain-containing protein [Hasllibacter sp. MH4015]|uniref:SRPBCC domain-containing protein n=1 Tax=Hasllibacter sp. MH4015 TaxID=2854029 RepID=UPI001CD4F6D5|nr:SRPBCC domain-containing protein [Hasllibacter sp. MH4015]
MPEPCKVTEDGDSALVIDRQFDAPRPDVWRANIEPDQLVQWLLGPPGWDMTLCEVEARAGGTYHWRWRNTQSGEEFGFSGIYSEVDPGRRLADTQTFHQGTSDAAMGPPTKNIVTFEDTEGGGTLVRTRIEYADAATRKMVLDHGMVDRMEMSYARLDALLANGRA